MKYQKMLVRFMKTVAKILNKNGLPGSLYFNENDVTDLLCWLDDDRAAKIWFVLKDNIFNKYHCLLKVGLNPWCILRDDEYLENRKQYLSGVHICHYCRWRKNHGVCDADLSDYQLLAESMIEYDLKNSNGMWDMFSNQVYRDIIEKIECPKYIRYKGAKYIKIRGK